ncbi:MAG: hypothetical protein AAF555_07090 [Verrucomicrobiota bacterium]
MRKNIYFIQLALLIFASPSLQGAVAFLSFDDPDAWDAVENSRGTDDLPRTSFHRTVTGFEAPGSEITVGFDFELPSGASGLLVGSLEIADHQDSAQLMRLETATTSEDFASSVSSGTAGQPFLATNLDPAVVAKATNDAFYRLEQNWLNLGNGDYQFSYALYDHSNREGLVLLGVGTSEVLSLPAFEASDFTVTFSQEIEVVELASVPEPGALALLACSGLLALRRRR